MSATYHAICNHSPDVAKWGNKLDYTGIVCLIMGSYMPALYYGLYCLPRLLEVYLAMVSPDHTCCCDTTQYVDGRICPAIVCPRFLIYTGIHSMYAVTDICVRSGHSAWGVSSSPGSSTSARQSGDPTAR